jgi:hypothetical protein
MSLARTKLQAQGRRYLTRATLWSALLMPGIASAQKTGIDTNFNSWFMYFGDHPIANTRWGIHLEGQLRRTDGITAWQQWLFRAGVNFKWTDHILLTAGSAYVKSYPYGHLMTVSSRENRIYEQLVLKSQINHLSFQNRLRLEQRLIETPTDAQGQIKTWSYRNRFRYMLRIDIPFSGSDRSSKFGLGFYNEVFLNFGVNRGPRALDQNRTYGALTYKTTRNNRVELGYLYQYIPLRNNVFSGHNHTLQFAWYSTTPLGKLK